MGDGTFVIFQGRSFLAEGTVIVPMRRAYQWGDLLTDPNEGRSDNTWKCNFKFVVNSWILIGWCLVGCIIDFKDCRLYKKFYIFRRIFIKFHWILAKEAEESFFFISLLLVRSVFIYLYNGILKHDFHQLQNLGLTWNFTYLSGTDDNTIIS